MPLTADEILDRISTDKELEKSDLTIPELIKAQNKVRGQWENMKKSAASYGRIYDKISIELLPKLMEEMEISNIRIDGVGRVNVRDDLWTKTEDPDRLMEWLRENNLSDLIKEGVNGSTLKAVIKERIESGDDIPDDDIVVITPYSRAVITKG